MKPDQNSHAYLDMTFLGGGGEMDIAELLPVLMNNSIEQSSIPSTR